MSGPRASLLPTTTTPIVEAAASGTLGRPEGGPPGPKTNKKDRFMTIVRQLGQALLVLGLLGCVVRLLAVMIGDHRPGPRLRGQ